jgi:hypothetical protein
MNVANTILSHLGGGRFTVMTGAKNYIGYDNALTFKLPGGGGFTKNGINYVKITLDPSDTYTIEFCKWRGGKARKMTEIAKVEGVYCDMLREVFTRYTGLYTSLGG